MRKVLPALDALRMLEILGTILLVVVPLLVADIISLDGLRHLVNGLGNFSIGN